MLHLWNYSLLQDRKIIILNQSTKTHPIDDLIANATVAMNDLISKQTRTLAETAIAYRQRRGRHPPPGFDVWYTFASAHNAVIVEDFFDQIYHDLRPFWAIPAKRIRNKATQLPYRIVTQNGQVQTRKGIKKRLDQWIDMVKDIEHLLPNLHIPLNMLDEPRVAVPWDNISNYITIESALLQPQSTDDIVQKFSSVDFEDEPTDEDEPIFLDYGLYWDQVRLGCALEAPSRNLSILNSSSPSAFYPKKSPSGRSMDTFTHGWYISNWTRAKDACQQPTVLSSHGSLIAPLSRSTTDELIPLFSSSKLSMVYTITI